MKIIVNPHDIKIDETDVINEGEYHITQLNFEFSKEYTDDLVKKAIFIGNDNKAYEMIIDNNTCNIPAEILIKQQSVFLGVYAYKITGEELILRYSPSPVIFPIIDGSYKADSVPSEEITPSQFEQYLQLLQNGLGEVDGKLQEVIDVSETLEENGTYAKEQGDYAKKTTDELVNKAQNGDFDGATFTPSVDAEGNISWSNDKGLDNPQTQNIKGQKGDTGEPFTISKTYPSIEAMNADFDNMEVGDYVMIASSVEDEDNAKLYVKTDTEWTFITDFSGAVGIKGEKGDIGPEGPQGVPGKDGVGITTITSGQTTIEEDKTVTPVTVNKTDGSSQIFNVEAKNGLDGQNGQDGLTPTIGENGNWFLGDTDTGKPSRGEVGSSPDLTDYVKNTDYANEITGGTVKSANLFFVTSSNGYVYSGEVSKDAYKSIGNSSFISKGTLENIKDDYVGSSTPVQDLTSTVTNIQEEQDESKPKNTASGEMITVDDALAYKTFNVTVDGASEQVTTTGKNLLPYPYINDTKTENGITFTDNGDGTITVNGEASANTYFNLINKDFGSNGFGSYNFPSDTYIASTGLDDGYIRLNYDGNNKYVFLLAIPGKTYNNTIIYPMIRLNSVNDDSYEPYTGGQPSPSPDYPQEITTLTFDKITRCGKNLIPYPYTNTSKVYNGITFTDNGDGSITANGTATGDAYFDVMGNAINKYKLIGNYITGGNKDISINVTAKNEDGNYVVLGTSWNDSDSVAINKSVYDIGYIGLRITSGTTVNNVTVRPMMTMEPDTDYEPYQGQTYDIDLQGNEMVELPNGVKDELVIDKYGNVSLIKNVGKIVFDGSDDENWFVLNFAPRPLFDIKITDILSLSDPSIKNPTLSTNFISYSPNDIWMTNITGICVVQDSNIIRIGFKDNPYQTSEEFKNWLSTHNIAVYYPLANPEVISLGKLTDLITTEEGSNTFFINGNLETTLEVLYALDIKKYIDNKLAEISTAMIEEG